MKAIHYALAALCLTFVMSCLDAECRDCEAFNYDATVFNPDFVANDIALQDAVTDDIIIVDYLQLLASPTQESCAAEVDSSNDVPCVTVANLSYRIDSLGIGMQLVFERNDRAGEGSVDQVVMSYEFVGITGEAFVRTHSLEIEPAVEYVADRVVLLDTITLGEIIYEAVIDLRQPETAFDVLGDRLPASGRFTNVYFKEGVGLLGLRRVDGRVFFRED
ncbi:hypothetical protein [Neolewinella antarctica]|uniref:Lipoprotein n=1 Tax=Neolewinella antarctica TaxID=442734 RepID=A0ABX0XB64_9BACT|nr:hypothetical protein [Neolewinella antarctica]NJC26490.1 hypothetical protein [Neolewinella antarctica]